MKNNASKSYIREFGLLVVIFAVSLLIFSQSLTTSKTSHADVAGLATAIATDASTVYIPPFTATRTGVIATASSTVFIPSITPSPQGYSLYFSKSVTNTTNQGAIYSYNPAKPFDELVYYLVVTNLSSITVPSYIIQDDIHDVLDYADVIAADPDNPVVNNGIISWSAVTLYPNLAVTKSFRVRVRYPLAQPVNPDRIMTNTFGNLIVVYVSDNGTVISPTYTRTPTLIVPDERRTRTKTPTRTPSRTRTVTPSPTYTFSFTVTPSVTPSHSPTNTPTHSLRTTTGDTTGSSFPVLIGFVGVLLGAIVVVRKKKNS